MSWDDIARSAEDAANRAAMKQAGGIAKLHRAQLAKLNTHIDALYAQVLDSGAESLTRTQLYQYSKYKALAGAIDAGAAEQRAAQNAAAEAAIRQAYTSTLETSLDALVGKASWNLVPDALVGQYLKTDWSGERYSRRIWKNTNALAAQVKEHIGDMITMGKNPGAIKRQIMEDFGVSYDVAERLITTEASHAYNSAAIESYRRAGLAQVRYLLDSGGNVCDRCRTYAYENGGIYPIGDAPRLPVHPRCRCCYAPVVDLQADAMAAQISSTEKKARGIVSNAKVSARAGMKTSMSGDLTDDDVRAVRKYISAKSYTLNEKLRQGRQLTPDEIALMHDLDAAIMKMPEYHGTVYRSISSQRIMDKSAFWAEHKTGRIVDYQAYTSTSATIYDSEMDIQFVISSKHGRDLQSMNQAEREILIPRGTSFYVEKVEGNTIWMTEI